jgi:hypothetical protein
MSQADRIVERIQQARTNARLIHAAQKGRPAPGKGAKVTEASTQAAVARAAAMATTSKV